MSTYTTRALGYQTAVLVDGRQVLVRETAAEARDAIKQLKDGTLDTPDFARKTSAE